MMNFLYQSAFAEALGWSLIDSLWQTGAAWLFYVIITGNGKKFSSQQRHSFALIGSAIGTVLFIVSIAFNYYSASNNLNFFSVAYFIEKQAGEYLMGYSFAAAIISVISFFYLPAVAFFTVRLLLHVNANKNVYGKNLTEADSQIAAFVDEMSVKSGIVKKVTLWISDKVESPLTLGFWKPLIFLPVAAFSNLTYTQVEAVIMHELYHIKRNDYAINIFLTVAEVIMFFNPFARMLFATVKKERENSCDDFVIASGFDAWEYSQALYLLGRYSNEKNTLAVAATGEGREYLLLRIRRIMKKNNPSPSVMKPFITFFLCLFLAGIASRQKRIASLPPVSVNTKAMPVVYYEEKQITITPDEKVASSDQAAPKKTSADDINKRHNKVNILIVSEPEVAEDHNDEDPDQPVVRFVAAPQVIEYTIIDPVKPAVPLVVCESPQPYIQKSSFYYTEIDTTAGKKVIVL